jgi:hypothetical protein
MLGAMPKTKAKRPSSTKSRSATEAPAKKAKPKAPAKRAKPARAAKSNGGIDPRVLAAIGLALEDEAQASARAEELARPQSPWVALGRVRAVKTPR